jgi:spermidine synthase
LANWGPAFLLLCLVPLYYLFPEIRTIFVDDSATEITYMSFANVLITEIGSAGVVLLLPSLCMGMAYPSVCQTCISRKEKVAEESGRIFFLGSMGSAFGAFVVGLFVIPRLDLVGTLGLLASVSCLASLFTMFIVQYQNSMPKTLFQYSSLLLIVLAVFYGWFGPPFTKESRLIKEASGWRFQNNQYEHVVHYESGASATVSVRHTEVPERFKFRVLFVDGQEVASTVPAAKGDSKMLAHLPLMLHANPKRALTVGFGSGGTSWSMTRYGIDVDCVEIEPEVVRTAYLFEHQNHQVLREPNMNLIINDARNYLHLTKQRYDVISTDVTNLHYKQNSSLYTREYFSLLKSRLTKGGIVAAWVPLTGIDEGDLKIFLKTFQDVFTHSSVWTIGKPSESHFAIVLGTPNRLRIDDRRLAKLFADPEIGRDLAEIGIYDPRMFKSFLLLDEAATRNYAGDADLHTDDHPVLEFYSARGYYSDKVKMSSVLGFRDSNSR